MDLSVPLRMHHHVERAPNLTMAQRIGSMVIEGVEPELDCGRHAVKRVVGDSFRVRADIFKEGHDVVAAVVRWRQIGPLAQASPEWNETAMRPLGNDRFGSEFPLARNGGYAYTIEAWPTATFRCSSAAQVRKASGQASMV
jgi:starch synthase (maltosyl-transferring)